MRIQDAEAPGREDEQADSGEEDADDGDRQLADVARKTGSDEEEDPGRKDDAGHDEKRDGERQERRHDSGHAAGKLFLLLREQLRVHRNERSREDALAEEVLEEVRNTDGRLESARGVRVAEVVREDLLAHEAGDPAEKNPGGDQQRKPGARLRTGLRRRGRGRRRRQRAT